MANNRTSILLTLQNEGGYTNGRGDFGGETYMGISRRFHPTWPGWAQIDALKKSAVIPQGANQLVDVDLVITFYQKEFWAPIKGDNIADQNIANQLFDHAVTAGPSDAVRIVQRIGATKEDGVMGPVTLARLNQMILDDKYFVRRKIMQERIRYYLKESDQSGQQLANLASWLGRTYKCYQGK